MRAQAPRLDRRRSLGEVIVEAFALYRSDWRGFVTIAAATIPFSLVISAVQLSVHDELGQQLAVSGAFIASMPFLAVIEGAIVAHLLSLGRQVPGGEGQAFMQAIRRAGSLIGAFAIVILVFAGLTLIIIGIPIAVYLIVRWLFVPQTVIVDGASATGALHASSELVRGSWWGTLGRALVVALLVLSSNLVLLSLVARGPDALYALVSAIAGAFTTPYLAIAFTLIYFDLKTKKASVD
jgi:hypothetical protein